MNDDKMPEKLRNNKEAQEIARRKKQLEERLELAKLRLIAMGIKINEQS